MGVVETATHLNEKAFPAWQQAGQQFRGSDLIAACDSCVACGLCLPHCPTYRLTQNEAESPRGRIALIRGMLEEKLPVDETLYRHLDHCLLCRACQSVCPAQVQYEHIMDHARAHMHEHAPGLLAKLPSSLSAGLSKIAQWPLALRGFSLAAKVLRFTRLHHRFSRTAAVKPLSRAIERIQPAPKWQPVYPAQGVHRGDVALFVGCVAQWFDTQTLLSSIRVLNKFGYTVHVPPAQGCCGALDVHRGHLPGYINNVHRNLNAFENISVDAIISTASACGASLKKYATAASLASEIHPRATQFASKVVDINQFLVDTWPTDSVRCQPSEQPVVIHTPCSVRNESGPSDMSERLLGKVPGLRLHALPEEQGCCGAAGLNMFKYPTTAETLRAGTLENMRNLVGVLGEKCNYIIATTNVGCAMHLSLPGENPLQQAYEVVHPVTLIDRYLVDGTQGESQ